MTNKQVYNSRAWLNKGSSPSTGNVVAFDGNTTWKGDVHRQTFLSISDCSISIRLHPTDDDTIADFVDKLNILKREIEAFIDHLEKNQKWDTPNDHSTGNRSQYST